VRRLLKQGHDCVVFSRTARAVAELSQEGAAGAASLPEMVSTMTPPRAIWLMVPAGAVDQQIALLRAHLKQGDIVIDGGNSYYRDDIRRAKDLSTVGLHHVDVEARWLGRWARAPRGAERLASVGSASSGSIPLTGRVRPLWRVSARAPPPRPPVSSRADVTGGLQDRWCG
jgi:hypothetical protein